MKKPEYPASSKNEIVDVKPLSQLKNLMTLVLCNNYIKDISGIKEIIGEEGIGFEMEGKLLRNWNEGEWHFDEEFKRMKIIQRRKEIINS